MQIDNYTFSPIYKTEVTTQRACLTFVIVRQALLFIYYKSLLLEDLDSDRLLTEGHLHCLKLASSGIVT